MADSLFVFGIDLVDGGIDAVLDEFVEHGIGGVALAVAYHNARDVLPHNPVRKLYYHEGGTVFFEPDQSLYGTIEPRANGLVGQHGDLLERLCEAAQRRSMSVTAWTVFLHNSRLSMTHPQHAPRNAFGDRLLTDLCPADPAVQEYATSLTRDISRYPVTRVMAEALHFKTLEHGYHHERYFLDLGPTARFLLGLCFCSSCVAAADDRGVAAETVRRSVVEYLRPIFETGSGGHEPLDVTAVGAMSGGEMAGYLSARAGSVSQLVDQVAQAARETGMSFTFSAHGGSAKGGSARSTDHPDDAWVLGVDLARAADASDSFEILGYVEEPADLELLIDGYTQRIGSVPFNVALRPMWPDTTSAESLVSKARTARLKGAAGLDFYHYGLMPKLSLDWIASTATS
jgi:hypothetical protein